MSNAMEKMVKARTALIIDQRFFGSLALRLQLKEDPTAKTMWIDGVTIGFNPEWTESLTMDELKGVVCHEVMHVVLGHHLRRNGRDMDDWNDAADYATDPIILSAGLKLPEGGHVAAEFKEQSAETIYSTIHGRKQKPNPGQNSPNPSQGGQQAPSQGNGQGNPPQSGKSPSKPNPTGEVRDYPGVDGVKPTEADKQQQEQNWQIAAASAAQTAEGCGQMPGSLKTVVTQMLEPKVPWKEVLQRFVDQVSHNDYSYARTNSRYAAFGIIMPSLYNKELPPIDVWIDTSGSISNEDKKQFVGEINDIRSHYRTTIRIVYCDTDVRHVEIIEPDMPFDKMEDYGGGGTRFAPAITWSNEQEDHPCCGIYLTDMDCSDHGKEPDFPVLWIDTRGSSYTPIPPFGEKVVMNPRRF